jgi:hypothetical protein
MKSASSSSRVIPTLADGEGPRDRRLMIQTNLGDARLFVTPSLTLGMTNRALGRPRIVSLIFENHAC